MSVEPGLFGCLHRARHHRRLQRRAVGVKQMMILLGVQEAQIEAVSFGEEKSRSSGKDDRSMAENRRSDIAYDGE